MQVGCDYRVQQNFSSDVIVDVQLGQMDEVFGFGYAPFGVVSAVDEGEIYFRL